MSFVKSSKRYVLKLHGCATKDPGQIILTSSDYFGLSRDVKYERMLAYIFQRYSLFTVGFGLRDQDLKKFIEERRHLYGNECPPIYAVVSDRDVSELEIDAYQHIYNVNIIPISASNNYEELNSLLLSIYSLVYSIDSNILAKDLENLLVYRMRNTHLISTGEEIVLPEQFEDAIALLSVFKDPIELDLFTSICMDFGLSLVSPAHLRAISSADIDDKIVVTRGKKPKVDHIRHVAKWIGSQLDTIPTNKFPRYLTTYYKSSIKKYANTLEYLLFIDQGWEGIFERNASSRFEKVSQYYKQSGKWNVWFDIINKTDEFTITTEEMKNAILRNKLWLLFWTRRCEEAIELLDKFPSIDDMGDKNSYRQRIKYMQSSDLESLIEMLKNQPEKDVFAESLIGRSYARMAMKKVSEHRKDYLESARYHLQAALEAARSSYDLIEVSVQSWYLACVCSDLGSVDEAKLYIAETKRLDESIMQRVPGIAWLKVAEYRVAINDNTASKEVRELLRSEAIKRMAELGVKDPEIFVDSDYYY
jgi:tetratricopeptide (TPR) repeat protein